MDGRPHGYEGLKLKTVQVTLPSELLEKIDQAVAELDTNRSAFARRAFEDALLRLRIEEMERQDAESYALLPQDSADAAVWNAPKTGVKAAQVEAR